MKKFLKTLMFTCLLAILTVASINAAEIVSEGSQVDASGNVLYSWALDSDGTLTFTKGTSANLVSSADYTSFASWRAETSEGQTETNETLVKTIIIGEGFTTIENTKTSSNPTLAGYPNLVKIDLCDVGRIRNVGQKVAVGFFENNPELTTIYSGDSENNAPGVINLEFANRFDGSWGSCNASIRAFAGCTSITDVIMFPEANNDSQYFYFTDSMFSGCTALKSITFPSNFTSIAANAFSDCTALESITIPVNITTVEANAFVGCNNLTSVTLENENITLTAESFPSNEILTIYCYSAAQVETVKALYPNATVEESPAEIVSEDEQAGYYSWSLNSKGVLTITAAEGITELRTDNSNYTAFNTWKTTYGSQVQKLILDNAFVKMTAQNAKTVMADLTNCKEINMGGITYVRNSWGSGMFLNCSSLITVYGSSTVRQKNVVDISYITGFEGGNCMNNMFNGCSAMTKIILPTGNSKAEFCLIGAKAFNSCSSLTEITLPTWVTSIASDAFTGCSKLASITLENPDLSLEGVTIPENEGIIICCSSQTQYDYVEENITFATPMGIQHTGEEVGYYSWSLDTLNSTLTFTPAEGVTELKTASEAEGNLTAFNTWKETYGSQVEHIVIGNGFTTITGAKAVMVISNYPNLQSINLGDVTYLHANWIPSGVGMFEGNSALTTVWSNKVTKQDGVVDISYITDFRGSLSQTGAHEIFSGCSSMTKVILPKNLPSVNGGTMSFIGKGMFNGCKSLKSIQIPSYVETIYADAFNGCEALTELVIPKGVTTVGAGAFNGCNGLENITVKSTNITFEDAAPFTDNAGLTIICYTDAIKEALGITEANVISLEGIINAEGFSIRYNGYNGLRSYFSYDSAKLPEGFTLAESGLIFASEDTYTTWNGIELGKNTEGSYITPSNMMIKRDVITASGFKNVLSAAMAKELFGNNEDYSSSKTYFRGTVTNFKNNYRSGIYFCSYLVLLDSNGNEHYLYADNSSLSEDYKFINLYDTTLNMYQTDLEGTGIRSDATIDSISVWNTLIQGASLLGDVYELKVSDNITAAVINDGSTGTLLVRSLVRAVLPTDEEIAAAESAVDELSVIYGSVISLSIAGEYDSTLAPAKNAQSFKWVNNIQTTTRYSEAETSADHLQGACVDDEGNLYLALTGVIAKVSPTGEAIGALHLAEGAHMGDITYYKGKIYGSLTGIASCIAIIDADKIVGDVYDSEAKITSIVYVPQLDSENSLLSDGKTMYCSSGLDGITVGKLPGGEDDTEYLLVAVQLTQNKSGSLRYDDDNQMIIAIDFDRLTENEQLLSEGYDTAKANTAKHCEANCRFFIYTGYHNWGIQGLEYDKDTGDIWCWLYARTSDCEFPKANLHIIDGSVPLTEKVLEVGQSVPEDSEDYAAASAKAALYKDADGNYPTELHATLKCVCGDECHHSEMVYGETGVSIDLCSTFFTNGNGQGCNGFISLGNGLFYVVKMSDVSENDDTLRGGEATLYTAYNRYGKLDLRIAG